MNDIFNRFQQISVHMQERQKEGSYLENDIEAVRNQLAQLKNDVNRVNDRIRADSSMSNNVEWNTLIYIVEEDLSNESRTETAQTDRDKRAKNILLAKKKNRPIDKDTNISSLISPIEQLTQGK